VLIFSNYFLYKINLFFKNCQNAAPYNLTLRAAAPFARITGRPCVRAPKKLLPKLVDQMMNVGCVITVVFYSPLSNFVPPIESRKVFGKKCNKNVFFVDFQSVVI